MIRLRTLLVMITTLIAASACARDAVTPSPASLPTPRQPAAIATVPFQTPGIEPSPTPAGNPAYLPLAVTGEAAATAVPVPTAAPTPDVTATPAYPLYTGPPLDRDQLGIQIHLHREDQDVLFAHLNDLPLGWVKVQVSWKLYEPKPGEWDDYRLNELDSFIRRARAEGLKVLLSVAKAPEWSRPTTEMDGPPSDYALFTQFMQQLSQRYQGQVAAYELWNEPNLQREWNGEPLSAARTVALIRAGVDGLAAGDPSALVISAAPATTGIDDGIIAIDDRRFLREMLAAGLGEIVDGVGVHPYGWANPPDASAAAPDPVAPSHNNHPSFFFGDTLRDYRALLAEANYAALPLWVTEFGWGSYERMDVAPPLGAEFMASVDEWQQATYALRAFELAAGMDTVGPLFLWNLNFAPTFGSGFTESAYSILRPDGSPRPLYAALQALPVR